jgi:hypothetical protein
MTRTTLSIRRRRTSTGSATISAMGHVAAAPSQIVRGVRAVRLPAFARLVLLAAVGLWTGKGLGLPA